MTQDADPDADQESVVRTICLRLLTARPRSRHELEAALAARGAPADVVARVLDRFADVGLVNDAEYARMLTQSRSQERGLASRAIAAELRRRGVDDETASEAVAEIKPEVEVETATRLARYRQRTLASLDPDVQVRRLLGYLARRGYSAGVALAAVRSAVGPVGPVESLERANER